MNLVSKQENGLPLVKTNQPLQLGGKYQALIDTNPYRSAGLNYKESPWQKFLSALGFRTSADVYRENMAVQADEFDAQIAQQAYAEQYNSPVEEMARMKAAGLNPDISGGQGISAGEAQTPNQDPSLPISSEADITSDAVNMFANGVLSCFSSALGLVSSVQGIQRTHLENVLSTINVPSQIQDFAEKMAPTFLPSSPEDETIIGGFDWRKQTLKNAQHFARKLPRKMRSQFLTHIENYWNSAPQEREAFDIFTGRVKNRKSFYSEYHENYSDLDNILSDIWQPLAKNMERIVKLSQKQLETSLNTSIAEDNEQMEFLKTHNATAQARATNASYASQETDADVHNILQQTMKEMTNKLKQDAKQGGFAGFFSSALLTLMTLNANSMLPSLPGFSYSKSNKGLKFSLK